jgi:hypothetical protein
VEVASECLQLGGAFLSNRNVSRSVSGRLFGFTGTVRSCIPACAGVRPPFLWLQGTQQMTTFSHRVWPP